LEKHTDEREIIAFNGSRNVFVFDENREMIRFINLLGNELLSAVDATLHREISGGSVAFLFFL